MTPQRKDVLKDFIKDIVVACSFKAVACGQDRHDMFLTRLQSKKGNVRLSK